MRKEGKEPPAQLKYSELLFCPGDMFNTFDQAVRAVNKHCPGMYYTLRRLTDEEGQTETEPLKRSGAVLEMEHFDKKYPNPAKTHNGDWDFPVRRVWEIANNAVSDYLSLQDDGGMADVHQEEVTKIRTIAMEAGARMYHATTQPREF